MMAHTTTDGQMANLLATAGVPAFKCPPGTKMHLLDLGTLQADEGWCSITQRSYSNGPSLIQAQTGFSAVPTRAP